MNKIRFKQKQQGVVLAVSLILLLVMTLVGVSGMNSVSLEEKMARNVRDKSLSYEATETALSEGEQNLMTYTEAPLKSPTVPDPTAGEVWAKNGPDNNTTLQPNWWTWRNANWWLPLAQGGNGVSVINDLNADAHSGAGASYAQPPVYITEYSDFKEDSYNTGVQGDVTGLTYYKITAYGAGSSTNDAGEAQATSIHQTTYTRRF